MWCFSWLSTWIFKYLVKTQSVCMKHKHFQKQKTSWHTCFAATPLSEKKCLFWSQHRKAFWCLEILVSGPLMTWGFADPLLIRSIVLIDKASYLSVMKSTSSTFGQLVQNIFCNFPKWVEVYVICFWFGLTTRWLTFSEACIRWDLSTFPGVPSFVASSHGTRLKG